MAARGMFVNADITITYDGVPVRLKRGTVIDVPAGSALNTALGSNITALTAGQQIPNGGAADALGPSYLANGVIGYNAVGTDPAIGVAEVGGVGDEHNLTGNN